MPAEHLRRLIADATDGRSVRELTAAAGVPENRLAYWLKPSTTLIRMPTLAQIEEVARIIGADVQAVYRAIRLDIDRDCRLEEGLSDDERALLAAYRRLAPPLRAKLAQIADVLGSD